MTRPERSDIPWPVFAVTVAAAFMVALDLSIVNVAFPSIRESFPEVSTATLSWVLAAYSVVFGALLLGAGRIADRSVAGLPQERFGTGGAINQTARQIGAVLGVALLIAIVGTPSSVDQAMGRFRIAWLVGAGAALGSAVISSFHRRPAETTVAVPVVLTPAKVA